MAQMEARRCGRSMACYEHGDDGDDLGACDSLSVSKKEKPRFGGKFSKWFGGIKHGKVSLDLSTQIDIYNIIVFRMTVNCNSNSTALYKLTENASRSLDVVFGHEMM